MSAIRAFTRAFLPAAAAIFLYTYAVRQLGPQTASLFMLRIPVTTALTGMVVLGEIPTPLQFAAIAIVAIGMALPWLARQCVLARQSASDN
jgi:drug/metabolite transporter (DMT)-like permease